MNALTSRITLGVAASCAVLILVTGCTVAQNAGGPSVASMPSSEPTRAASDSDAQARSNAARIETASTFQIPLGFEPNLGQADSSVRYLARTGAGAVQLTAAGGLVLSAGRGRNDSAGCDDDRCALGMVLLEARPSPEVTAVDLLPGKVNHLVGNDESKWLTAVPAFGRVRYHAVYPEIDLVYYSRGGQLEYDFVVAPGADPGRIAYRFEGADGLRVDESGNLVVAVKGMSVTHLAPYLYQDLDDGRRHAVAGRYVLANDVVRFDVGPYDRSHPLVIDPVIAFATYLPGVASRLALDSTGNVYISGVTASGSDGFVTKLSPGGTELIYTTFLGGSSSDVATGLAVGDDGSAYVVGHTFSTDFSGVSDASIQASGGAGSGDGFVVKLSPSGSAITYATYLGGAGGEEHFRVAVDPTGNAYVGGRTTSPSFPGVGPDAIQPEPINLTCGNCGTGVLVKINPAGTGIEYGTFLGGDGGDIVSGVAVDAAGAAYLTGSTSAAYGSSSNFFPGVGPNSIQPARSAGGNAFVTKINPSGSGIEYSTFLGGSGFIGTALSTFGAAIAIDAEGAAYVTGSVRAATFPGVGPGSIQPTPGSIDDAFVTKINPAGNAIVYSTFLGGDSQDSGQAIAVDSTGAAIVVGLTESSNFPGIGPWSIQSTAAGLHDGFVTRIDPTGSALTFSTYLGGDDLDGAGSVAADGLGNVYVSGHTQSTSFPGVGPASLEPTKVGGAAFVLKLALGATPVYVGLGDSYSSGEGAVDAGGDPLFYGETDVEGNRCHRSAHAYPVLLAGDPGLDLGGTISGPSSPHGFVACSGGRMTNVFDVGDPQQAGEPGGQITRLDASVDLVTLTVGGNDVVVWDPAEPNEKLGGEHGGIESIFSDCILNVLQECSRLTSDNISDLYGPLYNGFLKLKSRAPGARFVVLTYPQIFAPENQPDCLGTFQLNRNEMNWIRGLTQRLNDEIRKAADAAGYALAEMEWAFDDRWICSPTSFANGTDWDVPRRRYWFHPNEAGHAEIARRLRAVATPPAQPLTDGGLTVSTAAAGATEVRYDLTFTTSATGAIRPGGTAALTLPGGGTFAGCTAELFDLTAGTSLGTQCGEVSSDGRMLTWVNNGPPTEANHRLRLVAHNVTNPPAGERSVWVGTSADDSLIVPYTLVPPQPLASGALAVSSRTAGATGVGYQFTFSTTSTGGLPEGGRIVLTIPPGAEFTECTMELVELIDGASGSPTTACGTISGDKRTITWTNSGVTTGPSRRYRIRLENVKNPVAGAHFASIATSADLAVSIPYRIGVDTAGDFDADGDTDVSVFRPSHGSWHVEGQSTVFLGLSTDIPVPCDYDGDGATDRAVFRPSVGGWYVEGNSPVFFGLPGDIPVPADYDGDGACDLAVFRPSVGGWYRQGMSTVFFGLDGDVPVPADYDGDGYDDVAVFRPSVGGWYRQGMSTVFFGLSSDVPVPGDYDGLGGDDVAVYRPSVGGWYVQGQSTQFLGLSADIPVPGDYDGDGATERAVFRPSGGTWFIGGSSPQFFGASGDRPLPLREAIQSEYYP
jgi:hypothetical protein